MRSLTRLRIIALSTALAILLVSCTGEDEPTPQAFCDQLHESEARLQQVADDAQAAGSDLAGLVIGLGAIGEYRQMLDDLVEVAPPEIASDMVRARDTFAAQADGFLGDGSASGIAVAAIGGLFSALANQTAFDNVDDFARTHCGRTVFAFDGAVAASPPAGATDAADMDATPDAPVEPAPTGAFIGEDLDGVAWYSSQVPAEPLADHELPFVKCNAGSSPALWAMDIDGPSLTTRPVLELANACNMRGDLTNTQLTHDGRYVVSVWDSEAFGADSRVVITDTTTGVIHEETSTSMSARVTALTSEGLDATSTSVSLTGFDASHGGTVFFGEGRSRDASWVISIDDILDPSQPPPDEVDRRLCHDGERFNQSGTHCARQPTGSSTNARLLAVTDTWDDERDAMSTSSWASMTYWLDDTTTVGSTGHGRSIWAFDMTQDQVEEIVNIQGERRLKLWPRSTRGQVYFTSTTLDGQGVEIYEASLDGDEPVLIGGVTAYFEMVPMPS